MKCRIKGCFKKAIVGTCFCAKHDASVRLKGLQLLAGIKQNYKEQSNENNIL